MQARLHKFLDVLRIELQDLEEDLDELVELYKKRADSHDITNYVYLENKGLLVNELRCVASILDSLSEVDASRYESVDAMIDDLERLIGERASACGFPEVVTRLVRRKIAKVRQYIAEGD
ncbi:MAG: hypothetical protein JW820_01550 [Spirochaetales bacterium]|nr:hypothetical protein [Spirochaetales bacterium]